VRCGRRALGEVVSWDDGRKEKVRERRGRTWIPVNLVLDAHELAAEHAEEEAEEDDDGVATCMSVF